MANLNQPIHRQSLAAGITDFYLDADHTNPLVTYLEIQNGSADKSIYFAIDGTPNADPSTADGAKTGELAATKIALIVTSDNPRPIQKLSILTTATTTVQIFCRTR